MSEDEQENSSEYADRAIGAHCWDLAVPEKLGQLDPTIEVREDDGFIDHGDVIT